MVTLGILRGWEVASLVSFAYAALTAAVLKQGLTSAVRFRAVGASVAGLALTAASLIAPTNVVLHGWLIPSVWAAAVVALAAAIIWRPRRWQMVWLPVSVAVGLILAAWSHWYVDSEGLAGDPAPSSLWIWVGLTGLALAVAVVGWHGSHWWRRGVSLLAVLLCLLSAGLSLNLWVGYFRTVQAAWDELTAGPLPETVTWSSRPVRYGRTRSSMPAETSHPVSEPG